MRKTIIEPEIFIQFPHFKRGIIVIDDIENELGNKRIKKPLNKEIAKRVKEETYSEWPFIKAWDEAHLKFNSDPVKYPPSIKALLKRINKGGGFPFINSVVALFNYISIKHLVPCGGDDIDKIEGNLHLGFAKGNETFIPLGSEDIENPQPGEVIYFDDKTLKVMCRRWNWRNGAFSKITENTKKIVINIDGIGLIPESIIVEARDELAKLLVEQCKAKLTIDFLNINKTEIDVDL
ncbi:MAG: phenylalanine--tRNA ligase beta subunit-related protein [Candidatus Caldatribacteriota bacterium]|nr:phenylalanine--tRNA ligase beta subunit-related protein [Candidatus Caldatribacteriota bacterium]